MEEKLKNKFKTIFMLLVILTALLVNLFADVPNPDPERYKDAIGNFQKYDKKNSFEEKSVLFVGSSSIVGWMSAEAFPEIDIINRGFGGSHISDQLFFYDKVVKKYNPSKIVFYCGDNDIASKKTIEQVVGDYKDFMKMVKADFPKVKIYYIPIKPSISRWSMWKEMDKTNQVIKEICDSDKNMFYVDIATPMIENTGKPDESLFRKDGLHLNQNGYDLWNSVLSPYLK